MNNTNKECKWKREHAPNLTAKKLYKYMSNQSKDTNKEEKKEYWITPPELYKQLDQEFHFNYDPCPYPFNGVNGLETDWGDSTYLNPPFRKADAHFGAGPTAFFRKAIEENKKGKTVVSIINTNAFINMMVEAGAELRSLGRVKWLDGRTGEPWKSPSNTTLFILRGQKHPRKTYTQEEVDSLLTTHTEQKVREERERIDRWAKLNCYIEQKLGGLRVVSLEELLQALNPNDK